MVFTYAITVDGIWIDAFECESALGHTQRNTAALEFAARHAISAAGVRIVRVSAARAAAIMDARRTVRDAAAFNPDGVRPARAEA